MVGRSLGVPKRLRFAALSLWPGLAQIWSGQEVLGLIFGLLFAATLNLAVVSQFIWTESFSVGWSGFFGALTVCTWCASFGYTLWWIWLIHPEGHRPEIDRLHHDALNAYLQGKFADSRALLEQIVDLDDNDADALMQLGTLFVRTDQPLQARRAFRQCLELSGGPKWRWEIEQMLSRLEMKGAVAPERSRLD